ncbi:protein FRA10AC1 isoform X1 [Polypterus senegalus]|uniref:protein FRA10AC1 isoform X1 n=1 Tax=Polypterus senegalus TaxID=55291 RepID=UPI00196563CF|nr:protein FRA10AC1 isoform X1 [Polypterus senegalus]
MVGVDITRTSVMMNMVKHLTTKGKGPIKMTHLCKRHFRKKDMFNCLTKVLQQRNWIAVNRLQGYVIFYREEARSRRHHLISMNAYDRHKQLVRDYILFYGGKEGDFKRCTTNDKTDLDVIRENHRFLWREEDEEDLTWEKQLAKKYYDKLFKEYCIADLSRYKENKIGFRWRVEKEVISGKGQFFCGNKFCNKKEGLKSWEVNFGYIEHGEKKNALVKLRLCPECSYKLNYHHRRKEVKASKTCQEQYSQEEPAVKKSKSSSKTKHTHKKRSDNLPPSSKSTEESDEDSKESEDLSESQYWKGPAPNVDEKTREEEFDEYFQDMFL